MPRKYNYIYNELVQDESDIIGHIAYGLYKNKKVCYITKFKEEHKREPNEQEIAQFHIMSMANVVEYRFLATSILRTFLNNTLHKPPSK